MVVAEALDLQSRLESCHATNCLLSSESSLNIDIDAIADINDGESNCIMQANKRLYEQDGDEAREIAKHLPYYPFKGIPRFYDIGACREQYLAQHNCPHLIIKYAHNKLQADF
jgi:hypothetical protein